MIVTRKNNELSSFALPNEPSLGYRGVHFQLARQPLTELQRNRTSTVLPLIQELAGNEQALWQDDEKTSTGLEDLGVNEIHEWILGDFLRKCQCSLLDRRHLIQEITSKLQSEFM
jgi:hypothetical protein